MPPLQKELASELAASYGLSDYDAGQLAGNTDLYNYFKELATHTDSHKAAANWVLGPVKNWLDTKEKTLDEFGVKPETIAGLIRLVDSNKLNHGVAVNRVLPALAETGEKDAEAYAARNDLFIQTSDTEVDGWIDAALNKHAQKITEYKKGKKGLISLFVGEVMKLSRGKADAKSITDKITEKLKA
jgi:aspartyl-tRNA(Asn)/glutamyl-tRNA(Gln) amidotransferase subunit B